MVKVELRLDKRRKPKSEGYPIIYYIRYQGKAYRKHSGYRCKPVDWNDRKQNVKASHPNGVVLQQYLIDECFQLQKKLAEAEAQNLSYQQAQRITSQLPTFIEHWQKRIDQLYQARDLGNMQTYQAELNWLQKHFPGIRSFEDVNYQNMKNLVAFLDGQGLSYATIRHRMATIKAVWNDARKSFPGKITGSPFEGIMSGRRPQTTLKPKHQSIDVVRDLVKFSPGNKAQQLAKDAWLMAFALQGAGIIDVLYFEPALITDGYYPLQRLKMPKKQIVVKVKMLPLHKLIIDRWYQSNQPYLFPSVNVPRNDPRVIKKQPEGTRQYNNARRNIDHRLKSISKNLNSALPLTMKQARHSWIIAARDLGVPKELIEQCVGHRGSSVMDQHYFGQYPQKKIDEVNRSVLKASKLL